MGIPLPSLLRKLRRNQHKANLEPKLWRLGLQFHNWLTLHPKLYQQGLGVINKVLWFTRSFRRDSLICPSEANTFMEQWKKRHHVE